VKWGLSFYATTIFGLSFRLRLLTSLPLLMAEETVGRLIGKFMNLNSKF
jgi:hypothetical protein